MWPCARMEQHSCAHLKANTAAAPSDEHALPQIAAEDEAGLSSAKLDPRKQRSWQLQPINEQ